MQNHGIFGTDSTTWRLGKEAIIMLGGTRAVLMQIAHPLVAEGVYEHSSYMHDPLGRALQTFMLGQLMTFGTTPKARQAAKTINRLHLNVHGTLTQDAGNYASGTRYDARDPELLLWVYATLVDTVLITYPLFLKPLTNQEQEQYYQESKQFVRHLGLSETYIPQTLQNMHQYVHNMVYSDRLVATPQARQLAHNVLFPPTTSALRPLMHLNMHITSALLPPPLREIYDLSWDDTHQHIFDLSAAAMRIIVPHLPLTLRVLPITRRLMYEKSAT
jgi:uncharacterized protein (DUF2236 family)